MTKGYNLVTVQICPGKQGLGLRPDGVAGVSQANSPSISGGDLCKPLRSNPGISRYISGWIFFLLISFVLAGCGEGVVPLQSSNGVPHNFFFHLIDGTPVDAGGYVLPGEKEKLQPQLDSTSAVLSKFEFQNVEFGKEEKLANGHQLVTVESDYRIKGEKNWQGKTSIIQIELKDSDPGWRVVDLKLLFKAGGN